MKGCTGKDEKEMVGTPTRNVPTIYLDNNTLPEGRSGKWADIRCKNCA